jgi:hypothetical protein
MISVPQCLLKSYLPARKGGLAHLFLMALGIGVNYATNMSGKNGTVYARSAQMNAD